MKVLYSCLSRSWGGMEMFTLTAIQKLLERNFSVELLCYPESRIHIEANNIGIIIHTLKAPQYFHPLAALKLSRLMQINKYDIVHTQASKDLWVIVPALKLGSARTPLIMTKQVGSFIIKKDFIHKWLYGRLNRALAISEVIKRNLIETTPVDEKKVLLLHNGIDMERFNPDKVDGMSFRKEFNIGGENILIGMLARFSKGKGHEEFLTAAKLLSQKFQNLIFMVVGEASRNEEDYAESIRKKAQDLELNNIIFTGFRGDTERVLKGLDIFVFPSHSEAFGIALAEAMAMGKPAVCSNTDGVLDLALDGKTALMFEVKNADDLARKIELLIASPQLRRKLGEAARERALEKFDLNVLTDKVIKIYSDAIFEIKSGSL